MESFGKVFNHISSELSDIAYLHFHQLQLYFMFGAN